MKLLQPSALIVAAALSAPLVTAALSPPQTAGLPPRAITPTEYLDHLNNLSAITQACATTVASPACDPKSIGPDQVVTLPNGARLVEFEWLRNTFHQAASASTAKDPAKARIEAAEALKSAQQRLTREISIAANLNGNASPTDTATARKTLTAILAKEPFAQEKPPTFWQQLWQRFTSWLERRLNKVGTGGWSQFLTNFLVLTAAVLSCSLLLWWFTRRVRQGRNPESSNTRPHPDAPSSLDWQLWLQRAHTHAASGNWRSAIHDIYWSAISRLESKGLWPADRARTPREYLNLLATTGETHSDLTTLTRALERIWYGDRPARESDYQQARQLLERLAA